MKKKLQEIEKGVLATYQKVSPSTFYIERSRKVYETRRALLEQIYLDRLQFPPKMFAGAELLEFGSGTGEHSLCYLEWGAKGTFLEMNHLACERARKLFQKLAPRKARYTIHNKSLFDFHRTQRYDITVSRGVLHHTGDVEGAFALQARYTKKGGFMILGIGNSAGYFQRNLQRAILYTFAKSEEDIASLAEELFSEHLTRAEKLGGRSRRAIIYDAYVNPKFNTPSFSEILRFFRKYHVRLYSAWPPVLPSLLGDAAGAPRVPYEEFPGILSIPELVWLTHRQDDAHTLAALEKNIGKLTEALRSLTSSIEDVIPERQPNFLDLMGRTAILKRVAGTCNPYKPAFDDLQGFLSELENLTGYLAKKNFTGVKKCIRESKYLFRGTQGLGMNYYIGRKLR